MLSIPIIFFPMVLFVLYDNGILLKTPQERPIFIVFCNEEKYDIYSFLFRMATD